MKILFHFRTQGTGAEGVHLAGIADALESLGHKLVFSSPTGVDPRHTAGTNPFARKSRRSLLSQLAAIAPPVIFELLEIAYNLVAFLRNRALLAHERCDLIYERHAFFLCSTAWLAHGSRIPLVIEVNELSGDERVRSEPFFSAFARWTERATFTRATLIVVVSPHLARRISAMGIDARKILVLPNAVSEASLAKPANRDRIRTKLRLADTVVIGFSGWFVAWHRLDRLLAEFAPLARENPCLRLLLVGDGDLKTALLAQSHDLGIAEIVIFTGAIPHDEMPDYLAALDIAVVPHSNAYRSPIKLFEAMARALPVVAPRVEPIETIIRHGKNGMLFDLSIASDLRAQLARLVADRDLRTCLGNQAQSDIREHHIWTKNVEAMLRHLEEQNPTDHV